MPGDFRGRPLGSERVLAEEPQAAPREVKRRRAPACHAASKALRKAYRALYRAFANMFRQASEKLRTGDQSPVTRHLAPGTGGWPTT